MATSKKAFSLGKEARQREVLGWRVRGKAVREIADIMQISSALVRKDIKDACKLLRHEQYDDVEDIRVQTLATLESLLDAWVERGHTDPLALDRVLKILNVRASIAGVTDLNAGALGAFSKQAQALGTGDSEIVVRFIETGKACDSLVPIS